MLLRHALGTEPEGVWYAWNPLYQPSEKEKAEVAKTIADAAQVYANSGLVPDDVLAEGIKGRLVSSDTFPGIEAAYDRHGDRLVDPNRDDERDATGRLPEEGGGPNAGSPFADGYDPKQKRVPKGSLSGGQWAGAAGVIASIVAAAIGSSAIDRVSIGRVSRPGTIRRLSGIDVKGFSHALDSQAVRHTFKKHGNPNAEASRGNKAVTAADFNKIREITTRADTITLGVDQGSNGEPRIVFLKSIGADSYTYVGEIRRGKRRIDMITMWKR